MVNVLIWTGLDLLIFKGKRMTANIGMLLTSCKGFHLLVKERSAMKRLK